MNTHNPERFEVILRDVGGSVPTINRLRSALKCLLRAYGLRCELIRKVQAEEREVQDNEPTTR